MKNGFYVGDLNQELLERLSLFLNFDSRTITKAMIEELTINYQLPVHQAYSLLLAGLLQMDIEENPLDKALFQDYFPYMIQKMNKEEYMNNPYYRQITFPTAAIGNWRFDTQEYVPYEAFVFDDFITLDDGRVIPQIGFFEELFTFPVVMEKEQEWMMITPNEINTMKQPIQNAKGKVCTFGLGLGYYPYMVSNKENVASVTIVEKEQGVIDLFSQYVLPQFPNRQKIHFVHQDAFDYAENQMKAEQFDVIFTDLWHDPLDGRELYLKMKTYEKQSPKSHYDYWIEKTLKYYL